MNDQPPLISVGIPTYNRPAGLRKTLECIIGQTYQNLDIVISDNASPDPLVGAVAEEFMARDNRIRYFRQPQNCGQFYNFKAVLEAAVGQYFTWAADDDERDVDYLHQCLQGFQQSERLVVVNAYSQLIAPKTGKTIRVDHGCTTLGLNPSQRYRRYLSTIFNEQATVGDLIYGLMKRDALIEAMSDIMVLPWDHVLLARLALMGEFYTIPDVLMSSRPGGMSNNNRSAARALLLDDTPAQRHPWWSREKWLQQSIAQSNLPGLSKVRLRIWSYCHYVMSLGAIATVQTRLPFLHQLYRSCRYGEPLNPTREAPKRSTSSVLTNTVTSADD